MPEPKRIFVVADQTLRRKLLGELAAAVPEAVLGGTAATPHIAGVKLAATPADLLVVEFSPRPEFAAELAALRHAYPQVPVVLCLPAGGAEAPHGMAPADLLASPATPHDPAAAELVRRLAGRVQVLDLRQQVAAPPRESLTARLPKPVEPTPPPAPVPTAAAAGHRPGRFQAVGIAVSTGGPGALEQVIPRLPAELGVPVFVVQHMPADFTKNLAHYLAQKSALPVEEAAHQAPALANRVYLAPGGRHLRVFRADDGQYRLRLDDDPPVNHCRPAADPLFLSLAEVYGGAVLAVVMTGMGQDGRDGVAALKARGAYCLSQSADTCTVYGMPRAVDDQGLSDESIPLDRLAARIAQLLVPGQTE